MSLLLILALNTFALNAQNNCPANYVAKCQQRTRAAEGYQGSTVGGEGMRDASAAQF